MTKSFTDRFGKNCPQGQTIGSKTDSGILRTGIDREKAIAIDKNALRFKPLIQPGWGRQGIAYGAYRRTNGLLMAVFLLNGHNTSQVETNMDIVPRRIYRWLRGSETESVLKRIVLWFGSKQKKETARHLLRWIRISPEVNKFFPLSNIDDNLAVGWFAKAVPNDPVNEGNGFIVRATGAENGELLARVGINLLSAFRGLQNVPVYYIVILRERGAAYYAASLPQVYGLPAYPQLRPVAIDAVNSEPTLYVGVHQSILGQIGFRADTRVYGIKVETIPQLTNWYGTAHAAASFIGEGKLTAECGHPQAEVLTSDFTSEASKPRLDFKSRERMTASSNDLGGNWLILSGSFELTERGLVATENDSLAVIDPQATSGLLHLKIATGNEPADVKLLWRFQDRDNYWCFCVDRQGFRLQLIEAGQTHQIPVGSEFSLLPNTVSYLQISDDGEEIRIYWNGNLIGDRIIDRRLATATGIGILSQASDIYLQDFEAHPRTVTIPELDLGTPWWREGLEMAIEDDFSSWQGDLTGKTTLVGNKVWQKTLGSGAVAISQSGVASVKASVKRPNPGRTAYTVAWDNPGFADVSVTISPPGKERGQGEKGRGGLIFWQDKDNYIIVNTWLDDYYDGESISCFFRIEGFEEIYDAVWSNIGGAIAFGQPYTLRVVFDGNNYSVRVDGQTVLYRALTDIYPWATFLNINRVGIVVNWEWGNDTGSGFSDFVVKK